jgi:porin
LSLAAVLATAGAAWAEEPQQATAVADEPTPSADGGQPAGTAATNFSIALAPAPAPSQGIGSRTKLTGEWWGGRTYLADHGIDLEFTLAQFGQWVTSGGVNTNGAYGGKIDYRFNFDMSKLGLWDGFSISMHAESRFGGDILRDAGLLTFPNTPLLFPLPGDYHGTDITGLLVSQAMFGGRAQVVAGKANVLDLATMVFPQVAYGLGGFSNVNAFLLGTPFLRWVNLSMWGAGLLTVNAERGQLDGGFIVVGTGNVTTSWDFAESFRDGVGLVGFYRAFYDLGDKPGYVAFILAGSTKKYNSLDPGDWFEIPGEGPTDTEQGRPWDFAVYHSQVLWQAAGDDNRHADLHMGVVLADDNPSFSNWDFYASLEAFGPLASRPGDRLGVSGWYTGLSDNYLDLTSDLGLDLRDVWGFEFYYNAAITPWVGLTGDLQVINNERSGDDIAIIPMVRLVVTI